MSADDEEARAYRILDDRRSAQFVIGDGSWDLLEVAASALEPGVVAVRMYSCDPMLLTDTQAADLASLLSQASTGTLSFPETPRPCFDCDALYHTPAVCERAEWDPTLPAEAKS